VSTVERVTELMEPLLAAVGIEVVDIELNRTVLTITIDQAGGLGLDAIAEATRIVSRALDEHDPVPGSYTLEVTSPGLERSLRRPDHFARAVGSLVTVKTVAGTEGDRRATGTLTATDAHGITVAGAGAGGGERRLAYDQIDRARTVFEWGPSPKPGKRQAAGAPPPARGTKTMPKRKKAARS